MSSTDAPHRSKQSNTAQAHDNTPLPNQQSTHNGTQSLDDQDAIATESTPSHLILYFMTLHFLLAFCELILVAPLIKLFEQSLCISYYDAHDPSAIGPGGGVPEALCKMQAVQAPLATIRGWKSMFDTVPVLVVAVPFGGLADRYGRRRLMFVCLLGVACSFAEVFAVCAWPRVFPLELVWLSSVILMCGGGLYSAAAIMWAMAAESFPEDKRSQAFYYIFAAFYAAELIGSFTAAATIDISPWIPCGLSMAAISACLLLLWAVPSSPDPRKSSPSTDCLDGLSEPNENSALLSVSSTQTPLIDGFRSALSDRNVLLALPVFLTGALRFTVLNVLIQYGSNRFKLKISTGALFYTETAIVNIFLFLFAVPLVSSYVITRHHIQPQTVDLSISRTCVCLLCFGSLVIGLSPTSNILPMGVFVYAAGFGSRVSTLSLVSYWIPDNSKATLYACIAVIENTGHAVGDPILQQLFAATLRRHFSSFWQALPFFVAAGLYAISGFSTMFIEDVKEMKVVPND